MNKLTLFLIGCLIGLVVMYTNLYISIVFILGLLLVIFSKIKKNQEIKINKDENIKPEIITKQIIEIKELITNDLVRIINKSYNRLNCFEFRSDSVKIYSSEELTNNSDFSNQIFSFGGSDFKIVENHFFLIKNNTLFDEKIKFLDFRIVKNEFVKEKNEFNFYIECEKLYEDGSIGWDSLSYFITIQKEDLSKLEKIVFLLKNITTKNDMLLLEKSYSENNIDLNKYKESLIKEFDSDGNGIIDLVENNDFNKLLKNKQNVIIDFEKNEGKSYIQNFIKLSKFLKDKGDNIQQLFQILKNDIYISNNMYNDFVGVLKNQINTYNLMLISSLNMIISLTEDDRITFYEIYESFDKLNVFTSNYEKEISLRLQNIENKLDEVINSIHEMELNICNELYSLQFISEEISSSLSNGLNEINSSLQTNNLLTGIQTYQMYKINKNTKSLRD